MNKRETIVHEIEDCKCLWMNNRGKILVKIGNSIEISNSLGLEEEFTYEELNIVAKDIMKCEAEIISTEEFNNRYIEMHSKGKSIIVV